MNNGSDIGSHLLDLMLRAGSSWILYLLLALSLGAVTIMLDRIWFYLQERAPRALLAAALAELRQSGPAAALRKLDGARSMEAAVARACLSQPGDGAAAAEERKAAAIEAERTRYERRLAFLGTLGNNAPFVGLFGTVLGIIRAFHDLVQFAEAQPAHDALVLLRRADGTAIELNLDRATHTGSPFRHYNFSTASPRISATSFLSRNCSSATMVAFTTLCGLCVPMDFVSTLGMPAAVTTARTGPPAITPVPSGAGFNSTKPLP